MSKCPDEPTTITDPDAPEPLTEDNVRVAKRAFVVYETPDGVWLVDSNTAMPTHTFMGIDRAGVLDACRRVVDGIRDEMLADQLLRAQLDLSQRLAASGATRDFIESHKL